MRLGYAFNEIYDELCVAKVTGLMGRDEYEKLYGITRGVGSQKASALVVELGTFEGFSAIVMSYALRSHGPERSQGKSLTAIDNYGEIGRSTVSENLRRFDCEGIVDVVESEAAASASLFDEESIALLFLDAGKEYNDVTATLEAFFPKVATSGQKCRGIICGHDYTARTSDGMKLVRAVEDWKAAHGHRLFGWGLHHSFWWTIKD